MRASALRLRMLRQRPFLILLFSFMLLIGGARIGQAESQSPLTPPLRGMTISCPIYGQIWGSPAFSHALHEVEAIGINWVSIHPYAQIRRDGTVRFTPARATGYLPRAISRAQKAHMPLFWKPHLAYWGSFEWRGAIDFSQDEDKQRFARTYRAFILDHARFAQASNVPLLAVGVELERLVKYESYWRDLIKDVRKIYKGKITYAANWDGIETVRFWDALDYIGVQAYFPLAAENSSPPSEEQIRAAWRTPLAQLERLSKRYSRPVLFTEIGYPNAAHAAYMPWKKKGFLDKAARGLRDRLIRVAARDIEKIPFIAGMFWWKWIPGEKRGDFSMQPSNVRSTLVELWPPKNIPQPTAKDTR